MKTLSISWLGACPKCDNEVHKVETEKGIGCWLYNDDKVTCKKCGDALPGDKQGCAFVGEGACWQTMGWHETKLSL